MDGRQDFVLGKEINSLPKRKIWRRSVHSDLTSRGTKYLQSQMIAILWLFTTKKGHSITDIKGPVSQLQHNMTALGVPRRKKKRNL